MENEIISFIDYSFAYQNSGQRALENINLSIKRGEIVVIVGPTGCGKSTLLRSINGLIPHMFQGEIKGSVTVDGLLVQESPVNELSKRVGLVFQNPENQIFMFTVERDIAFGLENTGVPRLEMKKRVDEAIESLGIGHLRYKPPYELSDGEKHRVAIAGVLAMKPDILVLDEPTSLLDPRSAMDLMKTIEGLHKKFGMTILIVEHRLEFSAVIANRIVVMNKGKIVSTGPVREILAAEESLKLGVGIPPITRLHMALKDGGIELGQTPITPKEFMQNVRGKLHD
ncbi:MAG: ATP-binding cassette domain-containing protein [Thaumarchaeota archaeon]|nr:ATP-binding cassette domain-containing protein [Nitrososphaerota archaeon]